MNIKQAIAAALDMPHIRTTLGTDLGPRCVVTSDGDVADEAALRVHDRLDGRTQKILRLKCSTSSVSLFGDVASQPEMSLLAEHLRNQVPGAGPVITRKRDDGVFVVGFLLPSVAQMPRQEPQPQPEKGGKKHPEVNQ